MVVLVRGGTAPTAALAHELFHVVQCNMAVNASGPALLLEGTAEWFAAAADPAGFVTAPVTDVSGGTAVHARVRPAPTAAPSAIGRRDTKAWKPRPVIRAIVP